MSHHQTTNETVKWKALYVSGRRHPPLHRQTVKVCETIKGFPWGLSYYNHAVNVKNTKIVIKRITTIRYDALSILQFLLLAWWGAIFGTEITRQDLVCSTACWELLKSWMSTHLRLTHQPGCSVSGSDQVRLLLAVVVHTNQLRQTLCYYLTYGHDSSSSKSLHTEP
jgi:hypothetical protein